MFSVTLRLALSASKREQEKAREKSRWITCKNFMRNMRNG